MSCPVASSFPSPLLIPTFLGADEVCEDHPFSHPETKEEDLGYMRRGFPRILNVLSTLIVQQEEINSPDGATESKGGSGKVFVEFPGLKGEESDMRFLVPSMEKLLEQPKFFVIGFFGFKLDTSPVIPQIWALDDKLVAAIPTFPGILAYITMKKSDGQYFNYVFLESFELVEKWRGFKSHEAATFYSPLYYKAVRINHGVLPCSLLSLLGNPAAASRFDIVRTKYYEFRGGKMTWHGLRAHRSDDVFQSLPACQRPRPLTFASFLGDNAFSFYSYIVEHIGKITGLPVKMIDVASLTKGCTPRPADIDTIAKYNVDFAFTCGISYVNYFPNLVPLAAPVRVEERYKDRPIYYADLIVRSDSLYYTTEDVKGKTYVINEKVSLSGHLMPQLHFQSRGGLEGFFGEVISSGGHVNSIQYVIDGKADVSAIDSVVLDMEYAQHQEKKHQLRTIESTSPCTMPPFVASASVPAHTQKLVARALAQAHSEHAMASLLRTHGFARFAPVTDADYDPVRRVRAAYNPHK